MRISFYGADVGLHAVGEGAPQIDRAILEESPILLTHPLSAAREKQEDMWKPPSK